MKPTIAARKAVEAVLREVGRAPEQRAARRLGPVPQAPGPGGPRVTFLTPRSWAAHVQWDAVVGRALAARGATVSYMTCGGDRQICDRVHLYEGPPMPCRSCAGYTHRSLDAHGHSWDPLHGGAAGAAEPAWPELDQLDLAGLEAATWKGLPLGRLVRVPVGWYLCTTDIEGDPLGRLNYRRFLRAAAAIAEEVDAALVRDRPDIVVMLNGLFLFEQVAGELCRARGIDAVTYERGYVKDTVFFHRGAPASRYDTAELWETYRHHALSPAEKRELDDYLADRQVGARSISEFWPAPRFDEPDPGFAVMLTNVTWDTAVQGRERCFASSRDWIVETLRWFGAHPEHRLVVRVHPAEVRIPNARSREPVVELIRQSLPALADNIAVIGPDDPASSYPLLAAADAALVYTSTAGMEAALVGTPCITAATTQYGNKGFTIDPGDGHEYFSLLGAVLAEPALHAPDTELARRYGHFFFFKASLNSARWVWEPLAGLARITDDSALLAPGGDPDLDVVCRGILEGTPFVREPGRSGGSS